MRILMIVGILFTSPFALAAKFKHNPGIDVERSVASTNPKDPVSAYCKDRAKSFMTAAYNDVFSTSKRKVTDTYYLIGGHPWEKGSQGKEDGDKKEDPSRFVIEIGVKSSKYKVPKNKEQYDYVGFMSLDKNCNMVDTAKFLDVNSKEVELFDMADM